MRTVLRGCSTRKVEKHWSVPSRPGAVASVSLACNDCSYMLPARCKLVAFSFFLLKG